MRRFQTILTGVFAAVSFLAAPAALADQPEDIPEHVVRNIRISLRNADAVVLATVKSTPAGGRFKMQIDKSLAGNLTGELALSVSGFYEADLTVGSQLLVTLTQSKLGQWTSNGRYELVSEGRVRDHSLDAYLSVVQEQWAKFDADRKALELRQAKRREVARNAVADTNTGI